VAVEIDDYRDSGSRLDSEQDGHFGLRVLADEVADAGGRLELSTAPGRGTAWRLTVRAA
jgi:two-component system, NarL family, sensor kinase